MICRGDRRRLGVSMHVHSQCTQNCMQQAFPKGHAWLVEEVRALFDEIQVKGTALWDGWEGDVRIVF